MSFHVPSSTSYLILGSQRYRSVEVSWNWLQLMHCAYLQSHPGYFEQRLRIKFLERSRLEEAYWNNSEYEHKCEKDRDRIRHTITETVE